MLRAAFCSDAWSCRHARPPADSCTATIVMSPCRTAVVLCRTVSSIVRESPAAISRELSSRW